MKNFKIGQKYQHNFIGDYNAKVVYTVIKRTAKTVTVVDDYSGETINKRIKQDRDNVEYILPLGSYSMAPILRADKLA